MNVRRWIRGAVRDPLSTAGTLVKAGFGVLVSLWMLFPIYWMLSTSLKLRSSILQLPPDWIFFWPTFSHYRSLFVETQFHLYLFNSAVVAVTSVVIGVIVGVPAAYSLSRMDVPGDQHIGFWILSTRMIPPLSVLVPLYIFFTYFAMTRSLVGLTITHLLITLPMIVWIVKGFIDELPASLEESAMVDGCTRLQAFWSIVVPLLRPGIAAASFIGFIFSWNNFLLALVLTGGSTMTAPLVIQSSMGYLSINWGMLGAAGTVTIIPPIIISILMRNHLVEGITMGAVKG